MAVITAGAAKPSRRLGRTAGWSNRLTACRAASATVQRLMRRGVNWHHCIRTPSGIEGDHTINKSKEFAFRPEEPEMRRFSITAAVLITCAAAIALTSRAENTAMENTAIKGDYVEVRTASVFAGACHFNGEVVTAGRVAIMAWSFASGSWNGTSLTGVRVIAVVNSDENLSNQR